LKTKGSLRRISQDTKKTITSHVLGNTDKIRGVLAEELEIILGDKSPSYDTLVKEISRIRNQEMSELDKPWNTATLKDYPIPQEAIPHIIAGLESKKMFTHTRGITIRHALWISRICSVVQELDLLLKIAWNYALKERISEISNTDFVPAEYDKLLLSPKKLIERFENEKLGIDFDTYKEAFKQTTGIELHPSINTRCFYVFNDTVFAFIEEIGGKGVLVPLPVKDIDNFIMEMKQQKKFKNMKQSTENLLIINLKENVNIAAEKWG